MKKAALPDGTIHGCVRPDSIALRIMVVADGCAAIAQQNVNHAQQAFRAAYNKCVSAAFHGRIEESICINDAQTNIFGPTHRNPIY